MAEGEVEDGGEVLGGATPTTGKTRTPSSIRGVPARFDGRRRRGGLGGSSPPLRFGRGCSRRRRLGGGSGGTTTVREELGLGLRAPARGERIGEREGAGKGRGVSLTLREQVARAGASACHGDSARTVATGTKAVGTSGHWTGSTGQVFQNRNWLFYLGILDKSKNYRKFQGCSQ